VGRTGAHARRAERSLRTLELVAATEELHAVARAWLAFAGVVLAASVVLGSPGEFTTLDVVSSLVVFVLTAGAALGAVLLGRRTSSRILYFRIFEHAPPPPGSAMGQPSPRIAARAAGAAALGAAGLLLAAAVGIGVLLVMAGQPSEQTVAHTPESAGIVGGAWMLLCAATASRVAAYCEDWESRRGRKLLCRPMRAGHMRHVYYAAERADAG
jgi:hypothetical protein